VILLYILLVDREIVASSVCGLYSPHPASHDLRLLGTPESPAELRFDSGQNSRQRLPGQIFGDPSDRRWLASRRQEGFDQDHRQQAPHNCEIRFGAALSPLNKVRLELDYYYNTKGVTLTEQSLADRLEYSSNEIRLGLRYKY